MIWTVLFRGMGRGTMSVVVPISAVGESLPVLVASVVLGEHPSLMTWVGIAVAVPAPWLACGGTLTARHGGCAAIGDGVVSSIGIAMQYLALAQATPGSGIWPVAAGRVSAVLIVAVLGIQLSGKPAAAPHARALARRGVHAGLIALAAGALALVCYLLATRTQHLAVAVVLSLAAGLAGRAATAAAPGGAVGGTGGKGGSGGADSVPEEIESRCGGGSGS